MTLDKSKTVLVIEDDEGISIAVEMILEGHGYNVLKAKHGEEALDLVKKKGLPDLILLDMLMPVMDGWRFSNEFRKLYGDRIPMIVMTAASDVRKRSDEIHATDYISKPFSIAAVIQLIEKHIH